MVFHSSWESPSQNSSPTSEYLSPIKCFFRTPLSPVWKRIANEIFLQCVCARLLNVESSLIVGGSLEALNLHCIAQYSPENVWAIISMPSSEDGIFSFLFRSEGTPSRKCHTFSTFEAYIGWDFNTLTVSNSKANPLSNFEDVTACSKKVCQLDIYGEFSIEN